MSGRCDMSAMSGRVCRPGRVCVFRIYGCRYLRCSDSVSTVFRCVRWVMCGIYMPILNLGLCDRGSPAAVVGLLR
jgi:hypothetical protein